MSAHYPAAAPYSTGPCANYPTVWYGGPVPALPTGPARKVRPRVRGRGLGQCMTYSDILTSLGGGSANCDPRDSQCVMLGTQRANAAEDAIISSSCVPVGTPISFQPDTSQAAMNAFMNNTPTQPAVTVGTQTVREIATGGVTTATVTPLPPAPPQHVVNPSPQTQQTTTGTSKTSSASVTNVANGTTGTASSGGLVSTVQGYLSDITSGTDWITGVPNWAVVAAGGLAVMLMFSQHRR